MAYGGGGADTSNSLGTTTKAHPVYSSVDGINWTTRLPDLWGPNTSVFSFAYGGAENDRKALIGVNTNGYPDLGAYRNNDRIRYTE